MKIISSTFIFLSVLTQIWSQTENPVPIALTVDVNRLYGDMTPSQIDRITNQVARIIEAQGYVPTTGTQSFVVRPTFAPISEEYVEGLQKLWVMRLDFGLTIAEREKNLVFGHYNTTITGSGKTQSQAMVNALRNLPKPSDPGYTQFLKDVRTKLNAYYTANCPAILNRAQRHMAARHFELAIAELAAIPVEADSCQKEVTETLMQAYTAFQETYCAPILAAAKRAYARGQIDSALNALALIDPTMACGAEAMDMIDRISTDRRYAQADRLQWARRQMEMKHGLQMQKLQNWGEGIEAFTETVKTVGSAFGMGKLPVNVNLNFADVPVPGAGGRY